MRGIYVLFMGFCVALVASSAHAEDQIATAIANLAKDHTKADRLAAAKWLAKSEDVGALKAIKALSEACKDDDSDIRYASVEALGILCSRHDRPCPMVLIETMFVDPSSRVRERADAWATITNKVPREATPLLLKYAPDPNSEMRRRAIFLLADVGSKDKLVLAVLHQAANDRDIQVRAAAVSGIWRATDDLAQVVPHWLLVEWPDDDVDPKTTLENSSLIMLGTIILVHENCMSRPKQMCDVLLELLRSDLPVHRRRAARTLGAMAKDPAQPKRVLLQSKDVAGALRKLLDDSNQKVREQAAWALEQVEKVNPSPKR